MEVMRELGPTGTVTTASDWEIVSLRQHLVQNATYGIVTAGRFQRVGIPMLRGGDIRDGSIHGDQPLIAYAKSEEYSRTILREGDVVVALVGYPGEAAVIPRHLVGANISRAVGLLRPARTLLPEFLAHYLNSPVGRKEFLRPSAGSAQVVVNLKALNELRLPLPSLREQRAVSAALNDLATSLRGLERLLVKKRYLKHAVMQQLLTRQVRLPTFAGPWQARTLGELGTFLKGSGVRKDEARNGSLACIRYGEIYTHHHDVIRTFRSRITPAVAATAVRLRKGDLLFAGSGETKAEIGKCAAFVDDFEAYAGGDIVILRPERGVDSTFMGYYLNTPPINAQKASMGQGDAVVHIGARALADVRVTVPRLEEQTAIATVLSDIDAELAALEARREKTKALKQAMMQELLTGRTRLVAPEPAHA